MSPCCLTVEDTICTGIAFVVGYYILKTGIEEEETGRAVVKILVQVSKLHGLIRKGRI